MAMAITHCAPGREIEGEDWMTPVNTTSDGMACTINTRYDDMGCNDIITTKRYPKTVALIEYVQR